MHDIESMRSAAGRPSSLVSYFVNDSLNRHQSLNNCMDSVAENVRDVPGYTCTTVLTSVQVIQACINDLNNKAYQQAMPSYLSSELRTLVVASTHRVQQAREVASKYLNRLITSFPSLMCDPQLVYALLEALTLLQRACNNEFLDEVR